MFFTQIFNKIPQFKCSLGVATAPPKIIAVHRFSRFFYLAVFSSATMLAAWSFDLKTLTDLLFIKPFFSVP